MNFFQIYKQIVIDTNILFMAWYNPSGKCAEVLKRAGKGSLEIYVPDSVKKEIFSVLKREALLSVQEIEDFLSDFEINWVDEDIYRKFLDKVKVKHKPDKPVEAAALALGCGILSADYHFKNRIDIDNLLKNINE